MQKIFCSLHKKPVILQNYANTNKRTLIHYDEIGLFSPAYTDEKRLSLLQ